MMPILADADLITVPPGSHESILKMRADLYLAICAA